MNRNQDDMELRLLKGLPIDIGIGQIRPLILNQILEMGFPKYNESLSIALFDQTFQDGEKQLDSFEMLMVHCHYEEDIKNKFKQSLELFFREPVGFDEQVLFYFGELSDGRFFDKESFYLFQETIKKQNFLKDNSQEKEHKPLNDKARELQEKLKQIKNKIKEQNKNEGLNLSDIVSIVSAYASNINIFNVWDLTIYQLYTLYLRLIMKDNYETQLFILPHTSEPKMSELKHWASKLEQ
jgi:hypothetical protein